MTISGNQDFPGLWDPSSFDSSRSNSGKRDAKRQEPALASDEHQGSLALDLSTYEKMECTASGERKAVWIPTRCASEGSRLPGIEAFASLARRVGVPHSHSRLILSFRSYDETADSPGAFAGCSAQTGRPDTFRNDLRAKTVRPTCGLRLSRLQRPYFSSPSPRQSTIEEAERIP